MIKPIIFLTIFLVAFSLFAQESTIKFYLNDGSSKQYKITDIENISNIKNVFSTYMKIHFHGSQIDSYSASGIDSLKFASDSIFIYEFTCVKKYSISEIDSIVYSSNSETVIIGEQVWMTKNLDVSTYRNGDTIPQVSDPNQWFALVTGAWCNFDNNSTVGLVYGKLYNWFAVNDARGLAPDGWHIPSDEEWKILENNLGGSSIAGGKLKETDTIHWLSPNSNATNESGFLALPGGWCISTSGFFSLIGSYGNWWSSTENISAGVWGRYLGYDASKFGVFYYDKEFGFSVRCLKDK